MRAWMKMAGCSALAAGIGGASIAETSGQELWRIWQEASARTGLSLTPGEMTRSGDSLTIRDLSYLVEGERDEFFGIIDEVKIAERRDGSVEISLSPRHDLTAEFTRPDGSTFAKVRLRAYHQGLSMTASGGGDSMVVDILVPEILLEGRELEADDETYHFNFDHGFVAEDVAVRFEYELAADEAAALSTHLDAETVSFSLKEDDADDGGNDDIEFELEGLDIDIRAEPGIFGDFTAVENNLIAGGAHEVGFAFRKSRMELEIFGNEGAIDIDINSGAGNIETGTADLGSLDWVSLLEEVHANVSVESGEQAGRKEISLSVEELAGEMRIPMLALVEPQDFGLNIDISGLSFAETFWEQFDPVRQLPRDPAALSLALSGKAILSEGLFESEWQDPERMARNLESGEFPVEFLSLDIENFLVSGAGAEVTGTGTFAIEGDDIEVVDGGPGVDGQIDLKMSGAHELIDKLAAAGLLSNEQEVTVEALLLMLVRRDEESDALLSTIEVKPDGSALVNGLPFPFTP